jgi:hypothetical protein
MNISISTFWQLPRYQMKLAQLQNCSSLNAAIVIKIWRKEHPCASLLKIPRWMMVCSQLSVHMYILGVQWYFVVWLFG